MKRLRFSSASRRTWASSVLGAMAGASWLVGASCLSPHAVTSAVAATTAIVVLIMAKLLSGVERHGLRGVLALAVAPEATPDLARLGLVGGGLRFIKGSEEHTS